MKQHFLCFSRHSPLSFYHVKIIFRFEYFQFSELCVSLGRYSVTKTTFLANGNFPFAGVWINLKNLWNSSRGFLNFFLPIPLAALPLVFTAPPLKLKQNCQLLYAVYMLLYFIFSYCFFFGILYLRACSINSITPCTWHLLSNSENHEYTPKIFLGCYCVILFL